MGQNKAIKGQFFRVTNIFAAHFAGIIACFAELPQNIGGVFPFSSFL